MKPNPLRAKLNAGEVVYGTMIQDTRSPSIGQIMARAGCDFVFFDMEHGPFDLAVIADMVKVTRLEGLTPLVRVPGDAYEWMVRPMDAGAMGIMVPRIKSREQVERIIACTMYPPQGERGLSADKGHNDFQAEGMWSFAERANQENLIILQIEQAEAVECIDDLLSVPGVGAAVLGPNDLAMSMGVHSKDTLATLEPAIQQVLDSAKKNNVPCGIHIGNLDWLIEWQRRGMQIITYSNDIVFLRTGIQNAINKLKESAQSA
ncbi:MAG: aldolase [Chloroflexi bacterium]|jgi:2-keto-3-deoxy-L-rhamnonate aldolase RhmA|nr:aldolase [Chloroflexota bacterium]